MHSQCTDGFKSHYSYANIVSMVAVQVCMYVRHESQFVAAVRSRPVASYSVVFSFHNGLAQGKVPVKLNTVLLELVSSLLLSATQFHTPVVKAAALTCTLTVTRKTIVADTTQGHGVPCTLEQIVPCCSTVHNEDIVNVPVVP